MIKDKRCFELYGYDVLLDSNLRPWLIEVNASPSITADTPSDYRLKFAVLEDMLAVVDMEKRRRGDETRVGGFDLLWNDGPVMCPARGPLPVQSRSFLGGDLSDRPLSLAMTLTGAKGRISVAGETAPGVQTALAAARKGSATRKHKQSAGTG